jgi:hypothetical protein
MRDFWTINILLRESVTIGASVTLQGLGASVHRGIAGIAGLCAQQWATAKTKREEYRRLRRKIGTAVKGEKNDIYCDG